MLLTMRRWVALRLALLDMIFLAFLIVGAPSYGLAITLGQVDDFQDSGTAAWGGAQTTRLMDVGPNGTGDHSLRAEAFGGGGSGGKLLIQNSTQWTGDWTAAGVARISLDMRNPNVDSLTIRLGIAGPNGFSSQGMGDTYVTMGQNLPADNQWHHLSFDVTSVDWVYVGQTNGTSIEEALAEVTTLRLIHNADLLFTGTDVAGSFFVDNITAEAVVPLPDGDFNNDAVVDAADYVMWRKDSSVGDYADWVQQFGQVIPPGTGGTAVPEPGAAALLGLVMLLAPTRYIVRPSWPEVTGCL